MTNLLDGILTTASVLSNIVSNTTNVIGVTEAETALAAVKAIQIPLELLAKLDLTGPLWPEDAKVDNCTEFDYVIVGTGTAGSVLANRLTEDNETTVLAIEAGGDPNIDALLAGLFVAQPKSERDWNFKSTFDDYAARASDNYTMLTSGKMLGGDSSLNHFISIRGAPVDFDSWANITGDESWKYQNILSYFIKSERVADDEVKEYDGEYHGFEGPVGMSREPSSKAKKYLEAFGELGNNIVPDLNGNVSLGYTECLVTIADGVRQSTAYAYLRPIRERKNLYVLKNTLATNILFTGNTACAVKTRDESGQTMIYRAKKEIIVSAGVYNTPKLLMLSGIGPKEHLESMNISVRADLSVGNNLQDHVISSTVFKMDPSIEIPPVTSPTKVPFPLLTGLVSLDALNTYADYQSFIGLLPHDTPYLLLACGVIFGYKSEICGRFNTDSVGRNTMFTFLVNLQPLSTGKVRLNSADPTDPPKITTGYYSNDEDLVNMGQYLRDFIKIKNSTYFQNVSAELVDLELEECGKLNYDSETYWQCYALNTVASSYHQTSTCPMGSVVDSKLKVYNFNRLRVVDASVMPNIPRGNPEDAVLMIAEKAADMIKEDGKTLNNNDTCCVCT